MSDISFTPGYFNRYDPQYTQDNVRIIHPSHQYLGTLSHTSESLSSRSSERIIDNAILVTSVDNRTRQAAYEYFTSLADQTSKKQQAHTSERNSGITATVLGTSLGAGASYYLATTAVISPLLTIPVLAGSIIATAMGINRWMRSQKAINQLHMNINTLQQQKEQWNDPADSIIRQRKRVGSEGFQYVYNNDLKNKIVHPEEVSGLWTRDYIQLMNDPIDPIPIFNNDLLGRARLHYSWGNTLPQPIQVGQEIILAPHLDKMVNLYQKCYEAYSIFESNIANELSAINTLRTQYLNEISLLRAQWLIPAERMYQLGSQEAEHLYQSGLNALTRQRDLEIAGIAKTYQYTVRNPLDTEEVKYKAQLDNLCREAIEAARQDFQKHPAVIAIQRAYEKDRRMNTLLYHQSKRVVDNFFDQRIHQLDCDVAIAKQQVEQQRPNGYQHFTNLLKRIFHPSNDAALDHLSISSPQIIRHWNIPNPNLPLNWHDVYGQLPSFHSSFASDISENAWNCFWGTQGLGRFASQPTHSWNTCFTDRSHFPFQDDWFSVKTYSRQQQPLHPLFCRPVVVPPPPFKRETQKSQPLTPPSSIKREPPVTQNEGNHVRTGYGTTVRR